ALEPTEFATEPATPPGCATVDVPSDPDETVVLDVAGDLTVAVYDDSRQVVAAVGANSVIAEAPESSAIPFEAAKPDRAAWLVPIEISAEIEQHLVPGARASNKGCLEMSFAAYPELLEWSGR
ncbi:MAG: hypothetical protein NT069_15255, partial [Planctomycetota bacterium]|nr:hypothetical protein [Planctomycetota bacterium]